MALARVASRPCVVLQAPGHRPRPDAALRRQFGVARRPRSSVSCSAFGSDEHRQPGGRRGSGHGPEDAAGGARGGNSGGGGGGGGSGGGSGGDGGGGDGGGLLWFPGTKGVLPPLSAARALWGAAAVLAATPAVPILWAGRLDSRVGALGNKVDTLGDASDKQHGELKSLRSELRSQHDRVSLGLGCVAALLASPLLCKLGKFMGIFP